MFKTRFVVLLSKIDLIKTEVSCIVVLIPPDKINCNLLILSHSNKVLKDRSISFEKFGSINYTLR
ncbi:hypothetical protein BpHYR1_002458 [Brachionus plicatilis]|uniref:Uncharacterized protein n=1 Tax=Brachionus plicatilis TaxID=10195 RepID=A0A3M7SBB5_BRAPC|nr:hypothetical protein BpHYR1_002458 [Brachionus plicatilis]